MKFTDEEIRLSKLIAEKERKEIKYGDWYLMKGESQVLLHDNHLKGTIHKYAKEMKSLTPLWTLSDAIEWLKKNIKNFESVELTEGKDDHEICWWRVAPDDPSGIIPKSYQGCTLLEACLKAILEILKEEKK